VERNARVVVFAASVTAVVVASFVPTGAAPGAVEDVHTASDALWHAATYAALTAVGLYAVGSDRRLGVVVGVFFLGAGVEVAQSFVGHRTASATDAAANGVGVVLALGVAWVRRLSV